MLNRTLIEKGRYKIMDLLLIKNADVYAPKHLGRQDVLINGGKIVRIGTDLETSSGSLSVEVVDASGLAVPGVVFCVDIGVYHEEWGIGFRLEDNCLITEDGCENLSRAIPRKIDEIEAFMGK